MTTVTDDHERKRPEDLLDRVADRASFIAFVTALAAEREHAEKIENANPKSYIVDGALDWKNGDIPNFLYAALEYFTDGPLRAPIPDQPNWKMFADFLYCGKIIE